MNNLPIIWKNPHLRYCVVLVALMHIGGVWLKDYKPQFEATRSIILFYAVAVAANSAPPEDKPGSQEPMKGPDK